MPAGTPATVIATGPTTAAERDIRTWGACPLAATSSLTAGPAQEQHPQVPVRLLALALMVAASACVEPRTPGDCTTESDCLAGYREARAALHLCITENQRPSHGPANPAPTNCDPRRADVARWAEVVSRGRRDKQPDTADDPAKGFEVPPLAPSAVPRAP